MLELKLTLHNIEKYNENLKSMKVRTSDIKGAAPVVFDIISKDIDNRFNKSPLTQLGGIVPPNIYWEKLSETTFKINPARFNRQILIDTGRLRKSVTNINDAENIARTYHRQFIYGTDVPYAKEVNKKRQFIKFHPELIRKINRYLLAYIILGDKAKDSQYASQ